LSTSLALPSVVIACGALHVMTAARTEGTRVQSTTIDTTDDTNLIIGCYSTAAIQ
jgi:hypothetical protein